MSISIRASSNVLSFDTLISEKDCIEVTRCCTIDRSVSLGVATFIPVRTNNFKDFLDDFILPVSLNCQSGRIQNKALKVLAILGAFLLDMATLPIRVFTAIPRLIFNRRQSMHPLLQWMQDRGCQIDNLFGENCFKVDEVRVNDTKYKDVYVRPCFRA